MCKECDVSSNRRTYPQFGDHPLHLVIEGPTIPIRSIEARNVVVTRVCQLLPRSIVNLAWKVHSAQKTQDAIDFTFVINNWIVNQLPQKCLTKN